MFIVINEYPTMEVFVNEELTGKQPVEIYKAICKRIHEQGYTVYETETELRESFLEWLRNLKSGKKLTVYEKHYRIDMYRTHGNEDSYEESFIIYFNG